MSRDPQDLIKLLSDKKFPEARQLALDTLAEEPNHWPALCALAQADVSIAQESGAPYPPSDTYQKAWAIRRSGELLNNLALNMVHSERRYGEAAELLKTAALEFRQVPSMFNASVAMLLNAYSVNTPEYWHQTWQWYQWRQSKLENKLSDEWYGEDPRGQRIIIPFDEGFGDHIWALRFLKQLHSMGAEVIAVCPTVMQRLVAAQPYVAETHGTEKPVKLDAHRWQSLMTLPLYLLRGWMPRAECGYLNVPVTERASTRFRVGLCWAGSVSRDYQAQRNLTREAFNKLISGLCIERAEMVSLQKGLNAEWTEHHPHIDSRSIAACSDFYDTARLMTTLDAVISVDTCIPHLSAAMGLPTILLDRWASGNWWGGLTQRNVWYGSNLTILRQPAHGEWGWPIEKAVESIQASISR